MYLFISISLVIISLILLYFTSKNIFSFSFFTGVILALTFIGIVRISKFPYYPLPLYFSLVILFYVLGVFFANWFKRFSPSRELNKFRKIELNFPFKFKTPFFLAFISLVVLNLLAVVFLFLTRGIPFFQPHVETAKVDITSESNWMLLRTLRIFLPILVLTLFLYTLKTGRIIARIGLVFLIFIMATIYLFYGFKGYFIFYFVVPFLMLWAIVKKINITKAILLVILALIVTLPLVGKMVGNSSFLSISKAIYDRFTIIKADGINYIVNNLVPEEGFFYGATFIMDINGILYKIGLSKEETYPFNTFLVDHMQGFSSGGRIQTDSTLFGDFYVNFGIFSGILAMFLAGTIMQFLYIWVVRSSKNIFFLPLYISLQAALSGAITAGKTLITLVDSGVMILFILFLLLVGYIFFSLIGGRAIFLKKKSFPQNYVRT